MLSFDFLHRDAAVRAFLEARADTLEQWLADRGTESP